MNNFKKKLIAICLSSTLLISSSAVSVFATEDKTVANEVTQTTSQTVEKNATNSDESTGDVQWVTVEGVVGGQLEFDFSTGTILSASRNITSAIIPETINGTTVRALGDTAFYSCWYLTEVSIPEFVNSIGANAFDICNSLTKISVDGSNNFFYDDNGVLYDRIEQALMVYPDSKAGFMYTIPEGIFTIYANAFSEADNLQQVIIPDSVQEIHAYAFSGCDNLASITISSQVEFLGDHVFRRCSSLEDITVEPYNPNYLSIDGVLFSADYETLIQYPAGKTAKYYTIPKYVTTLSEYSFEWADNLKEVTIPNNVKTIESYVFTGCTSLEKVDIPGSITTLSSGLFENCTSLTDVNIANGVEAIDSLVFYRCSSLVQIDIPSSVTTLGTNIFNDCISLQNINVDKDNLNFSSADGVLFSKDKSVLITYPLGKTDEFYNVPEGVQTIGFASFTDNINLKKVILPDGVLKLDTSAFSSSNIEQVILSDSVTEIGIGAFSDCANLQKVNIPENTTKIGYVAFQKCPNLTLYIDAENTTAINFAISNKVPYVLVRDVMYGDVNLDGNVSIVDALETMKHLSKLQTYTEEQLINADVTGGGVAIQDTLYIQMYISKIIQVFPIEYV